MMLPWGALGVLFALLKAKEAAHFQLVPDLLHVPGDYPKAGSD